MLPEEILDPDILGILPTVDGTDPSQAIENSGYLQIGDWIAIPVEQVASRIDIQTDPELQDETGASMGTLCLTGKLSGVQPEALTKWQYVAYLADVTPDYAGHPTMFRKNYAIVHLQFFQVYMNKYHISAPIWGGFSHYSPAPPVTRQHQTIVARPDIFVPTKFHSMSFGRCISSSNSFDRFLKLYHSLELIFDFVIMKSIQNLKDDMVGFSVINRAIHNRSEIERLRYIIFEYCDDCEGIAKTFTGISNFAIRSHEVFQDYTKDGNPLASPQKWADILASCRAGQTTEADFQKIKLCNQKDLPYSRLISNISAYWIYRVRSSIAHSRISEFLFEDSDEDFIVDFAEVLLTEVVRQVFSSKKLLSLTK
ncbi:hypothetical protein V5F63_06405 [Xanthobacter autotrophicus DSM 597]|uniref:hypothetical protein n=1 Tax=Xanthobacter wiegelii TaxID=3119913 RepID=UPI003726A4AC